MIDGPSPTFSFEFFPPKDDASEAQLWDAIRRLEKVAPSFVSITYGAGGGTRDRTVRLTQRVLEETSLTPMAHLTCVGHSVAELRSIVGAYAAGGVRNILALRGDPQGGLGQPWVAHPDGLDYADELVRLVKRLGDFTVGVAAFPDGHPESGDISEDAETLIRKEQAGAEFAITQMVFDVDHYLRLRDELARRGSRLPVVPAIMPITNARQVVRMAELAGQPMPSAVTERVRHPPVPELQAPSCVVRRSVPGSSSLPSSAASCCPALRLPPPSPSSRRSPSSSAPRSSSG